MKANVGRLKANGVEPRVIQIEEGYVKEDTYFKLLTPSQSLPNNVDNEKVPVDESGFCIFHRRVIHWKEENKFTEWLNLLFDIGSGCMKYRLQTPPITIASNSINNNIVVELATSFSNYFTSSNGLK